MHIAVLDLTHGGSLIAQCLAENTEADIQTIVNTSNTDTNTVTAVDVHHTLDRSTRTDLETRAISVLTEPPDASSFDLIIASVHLDPAYPTLAGARAAGVPVITHHAAVGKIMQSHLQGYEVIEVTGTTAKTSTVRTLAEIISSCAGRSVVSHSSAGVEHWDGAGSSNPQVIAKFSITPASIIEVVRSARDAHPDVFIFEVSLGGTGLADIGIITTFAGDYLIANNTTTASGAKMQMVQQAKPGSTLILGSDVAPVPVPDVVADTNTFGDGGDIYFESVTPERCVIAAADRHIEFTARNYDIFSYETAILAAVTAAISMNIDPGRITSFLGHFCGVSGRMKVSEVKGRTIIDNSNSGMNIPSAESAINHARRIAGDLMDGANIVLIIGIEEYNVCEGLDSGRVIELITENREFVTDVITVGVNTDFAQEVPGLDKGMELAMDITRAGDLIISCVKCFR
ncbi:MAG: coenzyme F430 synthase [Methanosarcinales archaeon]|nr:MAG: coenzyme F430 synthase [Methanosarcinales archaeon]